jgi:hypothetical protein
MVLYVRDRKGAEAAAVATRGEVEAKFIWTAALADVLAGYRTSGAHDFDAYMPAVATFFTNLAASYAHGLPPIPFQGTIDGAADDEPVLASSPDPAVMRYVRRIRDQLFKTSKLVVGDDHTLRDQPHKNVIAYGTPADNPVIASTAAAGHWTVGNDEIVLGAKRFTGPGLVLIACWPRSDDPTAGVLVHTSATDFNVVNINSLQVGRTDWVVARKKPDGTFEILETGNFPRAADGSWQLPR